MVDTNASILLLEPLSRATQSVMQYVQLLVGGLFGLYLIYFGSMIISRRSEVRLLREIRDELRHMHDVLTLMELQLKKKKGRRA